MRPLRWIFVGAPLRLRKRPLRQLKVAMLYVVSPLLRLLGVFPGLPLTKLTKLMLLQLTMLFVGLLHLILLGGRILVRRGWPLLQLMLETPLQLLWTRLIVA